MQERLLRGLGYIVRYFPQLGRVIFSLYRLTIARYTLGTVGMLVNENQEVLLVEHRFHPDTPWGLPGGLLEGDESPQNCVEREIKEELNLDVVATRPIAVRPSAFWRRHMDVIFRVELRTPFDAASIVLSPELINWQWYAVDNLPVDTHALTRKMIETELGTASTQAVAEEK